MCKYIFVTGGVVSGLGKGITAASLGALLKARGLKVFVQKLDPYLNVDPGTMSPYQHGEVFVTDDGAETDLDLGHYERFIDLPFSKMSTLTSGMVYKSILDNERKGEFLGQTVQVVPHVTNYIKGYIYLATEKEKPDVQIVEIGGTVGDIESLPFLEAIRQIQIEVGTKNVIMVLTTLLPYLNTSKELKTKPTQHSVKTLMSLGIIPDFLVLRASMEIDKELKEKISRLCTINKENVIACPDLDSIYKVPILLHEQKMDDIISKRFKFKNKLDFKEWENKVKISENLKKEVTIAIVGKYISLEDAYLSIKESLYHAGISNLCKVKIKWIDSSTLNKKNMAINFEDVDGIIVPGGFGKRGIDGKILAINYARINNIPFLGICLGMQLAVIEYARNVCNLKEANSTEFDEMCKDNIIDYLEDQYKGINMGGTLRLGSYDCELTPDTISKKFYKESLIKERHRHRYELNNKYLDILKENGMIIAGINPKSNLVEIVELKNHPYFVACQFHPEFKSRLTRPHPLFVGLVESCIKK